MRNLAPILLSSIYLTTAAASPQAVAEEPIYSAATIRITDLPKNPPKFTDHPAEVYSESNATPDLRSHKLSRQFRTRLKDWSKSKPNFAGHFILASWGCGTDCTQFALIDAQTGKIHHPQGWTHVLFTNIQDELWDKALQYHPDSRMLMIAGTPEGRVNRRGIHYLLWENGRFKTLRYVPKPW